MSRRRVPDLTVLAVPFYFGSMALEHRRLKRRAEQEGPSSSDYEPKDTAANLAMGVGSLLVPFLWGPLVERVAPQRGRIGKALIGLAAGAAAVTTLADRRVRRGEDHDGRAAAVARVG